MNHRKATSPFYVYILSVQKEMDSRNKILDERNSQLKRFAEETRDMLYDMQSDAQWA